MIVKNGSYLRTYIGMYIQNIMCRMRNGHKKHRISIICKKEKRSVGKVT